MAGLSPTQRTLRALRNEGRICDIAEKWIATPYSKIPGFRKDLFGFIDIVALCPEKGILAIQSCGQSWSQHVGKIMDSEATVNVIEWLKCGGSFQLWGWRKVKMKRGGKAMVWRPRMANIILEEENVHIKEIK